MKRGVWQLKKLEIMYCKHGGSSAGIRKLLDPANSRSHRRYTTFVEENKQVEMELIERNGQHPVVVGHYLQDRLLRDGKRVPKQICVKNEEPRDIVGIMQQLRDEAGGKAKSWNERHWRSTESIQGVWTPLTRIQ